MKTTYKTLLLAALCSLAFSCTQEIDPDTLKPEGDEFTEVISGQLDESGTRANISNAGDFTWTAELDKVAVHLHTSKGYERYLESTGAIPDQSGTKANFSISVDKATTVRDAFAIYPSSLVDCASSQGPENYGQEGAGLDLTLPGTYTLTEVAGMHVPVPMIADNTGSSWSFKHLGAVLKLILNNIPGNTSYIKISMNGRKMWGDFSLEAPVVPGNSKLVTYLDLVHDAVTITDLNFNPNTPFYDGVRISIPLPTGLYQFMTITCYDSGNNILRQAMNIPLGSDGWDLDRCGGAIKTFTFGGVTVNASGDKVIFAPGNLQAQLGGLAASDTGGACWTASEWRFAEHQYDALGNDNANFASGNWVDLFAWEGASATATTYPNLGLCTDFTSNPTDKYYGGSSGESLRSDWGDVQISNYEPGTWHTLTGGSTSSPEGERGEWDYILNVRSASTINGVANGRFAIAQINGINGMIIFPDEFATPSSYTAKDRKGKAITDINSGSINVAASYYSSNTIDLDNWAKLERAGCSFIPCSGFRKGLTVSYDGKVGYYETASAIVNGPNNCYRVRFENKSNGIEPTGYNDRNIAGAVRLVRNLYKTDKTLTSSPSVPADGTVYGWVSCKGKGVPGVVVSDGVLCTQTNAEGMYSLSSSKARGYVFISTPSGYVAPTHGILPAIHKLTQEAAGTPERIDFQLLPDGDQTNHTVLVIGDMHLANRYNDIASFQRFADDVNAYKAANPTKKIYALTLGDMTWDIYWLPKSETGSTYGSGAGIGFQEYLKIASDRISGIPFYHSIGNHDHSVYYKGDDATVVDYETNIAPTYYSFNIGNVHYIVLDDIKCTNTGAGTAASRGCEYTVTSNQISWLQNDLAYVPTTTPLVVSSHSAFYNEDGSTKVTNVSTIANILKNYPEVHVFTGHSHDMYNVDKRSSNNIFEHNAGSICGTWWWTYYCTRNTGKINIGPDGSPSGYTILNANNKNISWQYKSVGKDISHQFRTYDRNSICITKENFYPECTDEDALATANSAAANWNTASSSNKVYINIWNWDPSWTISVKEGSKTLTPTRVTRKDPLQTISYITIRANANKATTFPADNSDHFWEVTASNATSTLNITVTDGFGNVYTETMTRPKAFDHATYSYDSNYPSE